MRWQQTEFILKGIYLGLLFFVALRGPSWPELGTVFLCTLGGLVLFLGVAAVLKLREGYRVRGRLAAFILFLLLENPGLVYAGVLLGLTVGAYTVQGEEGASNQILATVGGGAVLGLILWALRHVQQAKVRLWLGLGLGVALVGAALALFHYQPNLFDLQQRQMLGALLLLGLPGFYLLTFASMVEESEVEMAAICAALGIGLWIVGEGQSFTFQNLALAVPLVLYFVYTRRVLPGLRVFKHVLRGISYATVGQYRWALISLGRALQLDPNNALAREQLWSIHRQMDFERVAQEPETLALVNFSLCLDRVAALLMTSPRPEQLHEAHRLLDFVAAQRPEMKPVCDYWRAVAFTHQRQYDEAAQALEAVLLAKDSTPDNPHRLAILMSAWQLALLLHPELNRRVGTPLLALPGRRMEAIAAVERQLAGSAEHATAWDLKRLLYSGLTEGEYNQAADGKAAADFDHAYARELGLAQIEDPTRWQRGAEYLRMAARGLPANGPSLHIQIAKANEKAGNIAEVWHSYRQARDAGRLAGPANLAEQDRHDYFAVVKMLADSAMAEGDNAGAIENYLLYTEYERAGLETWRNLAELYERNKDVWAALQCTERALVYNSTDRDLLARKDRYYYSIPPAELRERLEAVQKWFDVDYCIRKARGILDQHGTDLDMVDWASHLLELAQVVRPASLTVKVMRARVRRLRGELPEAQALLEEVRTSKPEKFPSADEEDAWYLACRLLGDLYLNERPEQAVECLLEYRNSSKSGADTMYKLGVAYENLGDHARAANCYKQVVIYDKHPLAPEAREALHRLQARAT